MSSSPREEAESWVGIDATCATRTKRVMWGVYAVPFVLLLPWIWGRHDFADPSLPVEVRAVWRLVEIVTLVVVLTSVVAIIFMRQGVKRALRSRIGADQTHLLYDSGTGKIERYEWASVLTDKSQLLIGRRIVALIRPAFPAESLRALILPRLPATSFVGHTRFKWTALRRGNLSLRALVALPCATAVLYLLRALQPEWFSGTLEALITWLRASVS
jgi:hypothetical protein